MSPGPAPRLAWVAWATVCVVWGTTFLAIKIALETVPPFTMGGLRYVSGGAILAGLARLGGQRLPPWRLSGRVMLLGILMVLIANGGVVWAEQYVPSGLAAVLIGTTPFWMVSIDAAMRDGRQLHIRQWTGLAVGFAGLVLLVWPDITEGGAGGRRFAAGVVSLQVACAGWAMGSAYTRRRMAAVSVLGSAAAQMIWGGLFMLLTGAVLGELAHAHFTTRSAAAVVYLALMGSVVGFGAFSYALQHLDIAVVGLYTYVNPVIAVALGSWLLGEPFHLRMVLAAVVILIGIAIVRPGGAPAPARAAVSSARGR
jgi:drug/metabolite transporter (DMT)-like permease